MTRPLPIHFLTIVLNGLPFIRHHIQAFNNLSGDWHWHIVEGLASHVLDTAWCAQNGGILPASLHHGGLSRDGTTAYLDQLRRDHPNRVSLYRPPAGQFWEGKLAMVNAPLPNILHPCLLWQVDSDELWTPDQIERARRVFHEHNMATSARYFCDYFFGPESSSRQPDVFGNFENEWLRTWRFEPGDWWSAHEPPTLMRQGDDGKAFDVGLRSPLDRETTKAAGLIFQHFAYATEEQVQFKENYYGYRNAVRGWRSLQRQPPGVLIRRFLPWVYHAEIGRARTPRTLFRKTFQRWRTGARAESPRSRGTLPLAQRRLDGSWHFLTETPTRPHPKTVIIIRADRLGDNILSTSLLAPLRQAWPAARLVVACPEDVVDLYDGSPDLNGLISFDRERGHREGGYRRSILRQLAGVEADLVICPQFTRDSLVNKLCVGLHAPRLVGLQGESSSTKPSHLRKKRRYDHAFDELLDATDPRSPELHNNQSLLEALGIHVRELKPAIPAQLTHQAYVDELLKKHKLADAPLIAVFAGTAGHPKRYPLLGESLKNVFAGLEYKFLALGSSEDMQVNQQILDELGDGINLSGQTSLLQASALLRRCRLAIGVDTGLAHLACAAGCRNLVVLGGGDFGRFFPYSHLTTVVSLPMRCYWCHWICRFSEAHCISGLDPATVAEAIRYSLTCRSDRPTIFAQRRIEGKPDAATWVMSENEQTKLLRGRGWNVVNV